MSLFYLFIFGYRFSSTDSILDLVITSTPEIVTYLATFPGISDHECMVFRLKFSNIRIRHLESKKVQLYSQDSLDALNISLKNVNWSLNHDDITDSWNTLKNLCYHEWNNIYLLIIIKRLNKLPMMNRSLKLLLSKQRRLNRKYKKTNSKRVNKKYMHVCKEVKSALGQTVNKYIDSLFGI